MFLTTPSIVQIEPRSARRFAALALVGLLHVALIAALLTRPPMQREAQAPAFATIFEGRAAHIGARMNTPLRLNEPTAPVVSTPQIDIASSGEAGSAPADGTLVSATLPPRPDPAAPNPLPTLPPGVVAGAGVVVLVRALVLEDGRIGDATLAGSCGMAALDAAALDFVKANWRFLPAIADGKPVKDWIAVEVMFRPA
jgi:TonB family protein